MNYTKRKHPVSTGSIFDYAHNNIPSGFNPDYIPYARDVATLTTYQCYLDGVYDLPQPERISLRKAKYDELMLLGKPFSGDVKIAQAYIYNL